MSKNIYCGNCKHFNNEDMEGWGTCEFHQVTKCDDKCSYHSFRNNGWTEISPDNMSVVYNIQVNRLVIAWEQGGMTVCRMLHDISQTISTMAKIGGYYYMELPELKIE